MRTFFFSLALCAGLVFTSPGVADDGPKEPACHTLIKSEAENSIAGESEPVSRLRQLLVSGAVGCTVLVGGVVTCRILYENQTVRNIFAGAGLAYGMGQMLRLARTFVAPQADFVNEWLSRTGYSTNHSALQWLLGKTPRLATFGDRFSPNLNVDIRGRQDVQQQITAGKIGSVITHIDWLGMMLPALIKEGEIDLAANQLVTTVMHMSYDSQEILVRTREPHVDEMTRQLVMPAFKSYLFSKLAVLFKKNPELIDQFPRAVQAALDKQVQEGPMPYIAYRDGMEIVLNGWMADAFREVFGVTFFIQLPVEK